MCEIYNNHSRQGDRDSKHKEEPDSFRRLKKVRRHAEETGSEVQGNKYGGQESESGQVLVLLQSVLVLQHGTSTLFNVDSIGGCGLYARDASMTVVHLLFDDLEVRPERRHVRVAF